MLPATKTINKAINGVITPSLFTLKTSNKNNISIAMEVSKSPSNRTGITTNMAVTLRLRKVRLKVAQGQQIHRKGKLNKTEIRSHTNNNKTSSAGKRDGKGKTVSIVICNPWFQFNQSLRIHWRKQGTLNFFSERNTNSMRTNRNEVKEKTRLNC